MHDRSRPYSNTLELFLLGAVYLESRKSRSIASSLFIGVLSVVGTVFSLYSLIYSMCE